MFCKKCGEDKEDFSKQVTKPDKFYAWCDSCRGNNPYVPKTKGLKKARDLEASFFAFQRIQYNWEQKHIDRAKRYNAQGKTRATGLTWNQWQSILNYYDGKCLSCGTRNKVEADHIKPLSRGGDNLVKNIQPLCKDCNKEKGTKEIDYRNRGEV